MHKGFSLKFKVFDIFVIVFTLLASTGIILGVMLKNKGNERIVRIYHQNALIENCQVDLNTLTQDMEIVLKKEDYPKLIADFTIQISPKKGIRVHNIECYDHTCENMGWINIPNLDIICIPNDVRVVIESSKGSGDTIIGFDGGVDYAE
ncbi:MAG: NusG domain II-containing protein [Bacillales bacterium]|nr:NusG domain II-containing protein [Bacillales bacterium]